MALDKNGYIHIVGLFIKILPKLDNGIEIIGFLNAVPPSDPPKHAIMIDMNDGMILGVSKNCYTNFGIPSRFVYG